MPSETGYSTGMTARAVAAGLVLLAAAPAAARTGGCDALTARLVRATGASLAGVEGPLAVFRAADADRMSLVCGAPPHMLFRTPRREPNRYFFALIGLAAQGLAGAQAEEAETLALRLHQATLLTGEPQQSRVGPALLRCEAGDRLDGSYAGTLCRLEPIRPFRNGARRSGLRTKS